MTATKYIVVDKNFLFRTLTMRDSALCANVRCSTWCFGYLGSQLSNQCSVRSKACTFWGVAPLKSPFLRTAC